ncbi:unnamed protein product [Ectocarpus sp. 6 AP-2014]
MAEKFPSLNAEGSGMYPLVLCNRPDCLLQLYIKQLREKNKPRTKLRAQQLARHGAKWTGIPEPRKHIKRRCLDRYCTSREAVEALLGAVEIKGCVLDMCGGPGVAIATRLGATCKVITNDISTGLSPGGLPPDTNLDASLASFGADFLLAKPGQRPDWVLTSPPYKGALEYVKSALSLAAKGVALKLPLSFLEPCADRGKWLQANPPAVCVFLRRVRYTPAHVMVGEFWGVWYADSGSARTCDTRMVFCPE